MIFFGIIRGIDVIIAVVIVMLFSGVSRMAVSPLSTTPSGW
jgi:hypothetical protein